MSEVEIPRKSDVVKGSGTINTRKGLGSKSNGLCDVRINDYSQNAAVRKIISSYSPDNWDLADSPVRGNCRGAYRRGTDKYKLLMLWKGACERVLETLQETIPGVPAEIDWTVGWCFSDTMDATVTTPDSIPSFLINPCNIDGTMRFKLSSKESLTTLIALAVRQVCHVAEAEHNEHYTDIMTAVMSKVMLRIGDILNHMRDTKDLAIVGLKLAALDEAWKSQEGVVVGNIEL